MFRGASSPSPSHSEGDASKRSDARRGRPTNQTPSTNPNNQHPKSQPIIQITKITVQTAYGIPVAPPLWMDVPSRKRPAFAGMT